MRLSKYDAGGWQETRNAGLISDWHVVKWGFESCFEQIYFFPQIFFLKIINFMPVK